MAEILSIIVVGLIVGLLARLFLPGRQDVGILWTILLGVGGALIGNYIGRAINPNSDPMHWILSVLVAVGLLMAYISLAGRGGRRVSG